MHWLKSERENLRLSEAGISKEVSSETNLYNDQRDQRSYNFYEKYNKNRIWKLKYNAEIKIKTGHFFFSTSRKKRLNLYEKFF